MKIFREPSKIASLIFFLLLSGPPRLRVRDVNASLQGVLDWSTLLNISIWLLGAGWLVIYFLKRIVSYRKQQFRMNYINILSIAFAICLTLSIFISLAPSLSTYRVFQVWVSILFGYIWINLYGIENTLKKMFWGYIVLLSAIMFSALFFPEMVYIHNRLIGNLLGNSGAIALMAFCLGLSYPKIIKRRFFYYLVMLIAILLLILSRSRAAYAGFLFFIILSFLRKPELSNPRKFALLIISLIPIVIFTDQLDYLISWIIRQKESISTFSARTPLWEFTVNYTLDHSPWLGLGLYANRSITLAQNSGLGTAHSAFVEIFSGGGIIASFFFIVMLLALLFITLRLFFKYGKNNQVFTVTALLSGTLFIGFVSEEMIISSPISFTFWMMVTMIPIIYKNIENKRSVFNKTNVFSEHNSKGMAQAS